MSPTARPQESPRPSPALQAARLQVLNALRRDGQATRATLRETTGLANAALNAALDDLRRDDLLALANGLDAPSGAGRPAEVLQLNARGRYAVGVKVMERRVEAVLTDLSTSVINQEGVDMPDSTPASVVTATAQAVETLLARERVPRGRLLGVGLAMPGVINAQAGVAVHVPPFNWTQVPLGAML
ncbi:MAG TPA: hypothetical protein VHN99_02990, partial [Deinococcales bacterium]|nr:hypothetical protein [Deinococcales bacterium]